MVNIATSVDEIASRGNPQFVDVMFLVQVLKAALSLNWLGETKAKEAVGLSSSSMDWQGYALMHVFRA
jgi:hypothetical protein